MAVVFEGVDQNLADGTGGWSAGSVDTDSEFQGTGCIGAKTSGTTSYLHSGTSRNFGAGGAEENDHVYVSYNFLTPTLQTIGNGGIRATAGTAGATWGYNVDGSDTYSGGWKVACFDPTSAADTGTSTSNAVVRFGITYITTGGIMGNFNNGLVDAIRIGQGLRITGGTLGAPSVFSEFSDADFGTKNNRWGVVSTLAGVLYVQGKLFFGDGTGDVFEDSNKVVVFVDAPVSSTHHELVIDDPTTYNGCLFLTEGTVRPAISGNGSLTSNSSFYGGFRVSNLPSSAVMTGDTFSGSESITQNSATITGGEFSNSISSSALICNVMASVTNVRFTGNDRAIDATAAIISDEVVIDGHQFSGNTIDVTVNSSNDISIIPINGTNVATCENTGAGNCSIATTPISLTFSGAIPTGNLIIYDKDSADPQNLGTELQRFDPAGATQIYNYDSAKAGDEIAVKMIAAGYKIRTRFITLPASNSETVLETELETN